MRGKIENHTFFQCLPLSSLPLQYSDYHLSLSKVPFSEHVVPLKASFSSGLLPFHFTFPPSFFSSSSHLIGWLTKVRVTLSSSLHSNLFSRSSALVPLSLSLFFSLLFHPLFHSPSSLPLLRRYSILLFSHSSKCHAFQRVSASLSPSTVSLL